MPDVELKIRQFPAHPRLGRHRAILDPRSRNWPVRGVLFGETAEPRTKTWRRYPRAFDQLHTSECTIFTNKGMINSSPWRYRVDRRVRLDLQTTPLYKLAQTMDPWPGEDYDGTSVLAAVKAFQQAGLVPNYRWCFGIDDLLRTVSWHGPVGIGVAWYNSMFHPDEDGMLTVNTASGLAGGHAVEVHGVDIDQEYVIITNSWGESWGDRGRCYMSFSDLDMLLQDWGEALTYV